MPRVHDPPQPTGGPGSAFASTSVPARRTRRNGGRRRRKASDAASASTMEAPTTTTTGKRHKHEEDESSIGQDLINWQAENEFDATVPSSSTYFPKKIIVTDKSIAKKGAKKKRSRAASISTTTTPLEKPPKPPVTASAEKSTPASSKSTMPIEQSNEALPNTVSPLPSLPSHSLRRALAIDTRTLQTFAGDATAKVFLGHVMSFLRTVGKRGAAPCFLASTWAQEEQRAPVAVSGLNSKQQRSPRDNNKRASRAVVDTRAFPLSPPLLEKVTSSESSNSEKKPLLHPVHIRPPLNAGNSKNRKDVHVPKSLLAHDSWKYFGDLVHKITETAETSSTSTPLDVTILTTDVSLFSDTNEDSHKRGLARFWERLRSSFRDNSIKAVNIVVAETGVVALATTDVESDIENTPSLETDAFALSARHQINVAQCIRAINSEMESLSHSDYKKRYEVEGDPAIPVRLEIETMENNPLAYNELVRKWLREIVSPSREMGRIHFDLPETIDGTQCSVSLDLSYKVMPFRADSIAAAGLLADMKLLASSQLQVVQLVPLSSVDASLIFGVPMSAQAGLENDLPRYREMQLLARYLWKHLLEKDMALVVRSTGSTDLVNNERNEECTLYHMEGQTFLLMAEELPGRRQQMQLAEEFATNISSSVEDATARDWTTANGVLFRYATSEQLLSAGSDNINSFPSDKNSSIYQDADSSETGKQYAEYIDSSLDFLDHEPINPIFVGAKKSTQNYSSDSQVVSAQQHISNANLGESMPDAEWTDESGVGAREVTHSQDSLEEKGELDEDSDDMLTDFDYA